MARNIRISKGLNINLVGEAQKTINKTAPSNTYAIRLDDFHGFTPKMLHKEGAEIQAGEPLFYNKEWEEMMVASPVSGELVAIERGARRRILTVKILADKEQKQLKHDPPVLSQAAAEEIRSFFLKAGVWPFIKQRPYDIIARPDRTPKAIFISGFNTSPLGADMDIVLEGKQKELAAAVHALSLLTPGKVHIGLPGKDKGVWSEVEQAEFHRVKGPHPAGLVGTQINKIDPINKGEVVWIVSAPDLVIIGNLLLTGAYDPVRRIALGGSMINNPQYFETRIGAEVSTVLYAGGVKDSKFRLINGNVLTGSKTNPEGHIGFYNSEVNAIPEGDDYTFFGWNKPVFDKISPTRAFTFSWLNPGKKYDLDTNTNGEHRAFVVTGLYEQVFPLDIYPLQLLKACMVKDLDEMENLGMYEVAPEDFALTEFICISKQPHQKIIRDGLDLLQKEIG